MPTERQTVATQAGLASDKKLGYDGGESSIGKSAESPGPVMSSGSSRTALISSAIGRLSHGVGRWSRHGLNLLFPPRCAYCDAELCHPGDDDLLMCDRCRGALGPDDWAYCLRCGAQASPGEPAPESCDMCRSARLKFDTVVSMGAYRSELGRAVLRMKQPAGDLLSAAIGRLYRLRRGADLAALSPDVVVPVPMFWARRLARGTNSPDILAECLARHLSVPLVQGMLVRCRNTLPQASLKPGPRFANVRQAFRLRAGYDFEGMRVVLVDDILTTGATASEIAGLLKRAGASLVAVAVAARGVGDRSF